MHLQNSCNYLPDPALFLKEKFAIPWTIFGIRIKNIFCRSTQQPDKRALELLEVKVVPAHQGKEYLAYSITKKNEQTFKLWQTEWKHLIWVRLFSHQLHLFYPVIGLHRFDVILRQQEGMLWQMYEIKTTSNETR